MPSVVVTSTLLTVWVFLLPSYSKFLSSSVMVVMSLIDRALILNSVVGLVVGSV